MSMKFLGLACACAAIVSTDAIPYRDIDEIPSAERFVTSSHNRVEGIFDIVTGDGDTVTIGSPFHDPSVTLSDIAGFSPGSDRIDSAFAHFYFRDDNDTQLESVRIALDRIKLSDTGNPSGMGMVSFDLFDGGVSGAIEALQVDGVLQYKITRVTGDFYFDYARLEVEATTVPDAGSTLALFGVALAGLGAFRRKLS